MIKKLFLGIFAAAYLFSSPKVFAWGAIGHYAVWYLAKSMLTDDAAKALDQILSDEPPQYLPNLANFPDVVRHLKGAGWEHTGSYHFADIPKPPPDLTYLQFLKTRILKTQQDTKDLSNAGDVVQTILRAEDILRDPAASKEEKVYAFKFLVHMTGDAHQPLHVAYPYDLGGNDTPHRNRAIDPKHPGASRGQEIPLPDDQEFKLDGARPAKWHGKLINLHEVWDEIIIEVGFRDLLKTVPLLPRDPNKPSQPPKPDDVGMGKALAAELQKTITKENIVQWTTDLSAGTWAFEERSTLPEIYTDFLDLDQYIPKWKPLVTQRLQQAAVRLAAVLNQAFDPARAGQLPAGEGAFRTQVNGVLSDCHVALADIIRLQPEKVVSTVAPTGAQQAPTSTEVEPEAVPAK